MQSGRHSGGGTYPLVVSLGIMYTFKYKEKEDKNNVDQPFGGTDSDRPSAKITYIEVYMYVSQQ